MRAARSPSAGHGRFGCALSSVSKLDLECRKIFRRAERNPGAGARRTGSTSAGPRPRAGSAPGLRTQDFRAILSRSRLAGQRHPRLRPGPDAGPANRPRPWRGRSLRAPRGRWKLLYFEIAERGDLIHKRLGDTIMQTRILIVEDDPHILLGLEEILISEGFEAVVCNRGDKALEVAAKH